MKKDSPNPSAPKTFLTEQNQTALQIFRMIQGIAYKPY